MLKSFTYLQPGTHLQTIGGFYICVRYMYVLHNNAYATYQRIVFILLLTKYCYFQKIQLFANTKFGL